MMMIIIIIMIIIIVIIMKLQTQHDYNVHNQVIQHQGRHFELFPSTCGLKTPVQKSPSLPHSHSFTAPKRPRQQLYLVDTYMTTMVSQTLAGSWANCFTGSLATQTTHVRNGCQQKIFFGNRTFILTVVNLMTKIYG